MCYSAQIWADWRRYVRAFGVQIDIKDFFELFWRRKLDPRIKIPKGTERAFSETDGEAGQEIRALIAEFSLEQETKLEQELFDQRRRLADAQRALARKPTKAAAESERIAAAKIEAALARLSDLHRTQLLEQDERIFPGSYAPVMVMEDGRRVIKPMRYQCRPAGKPANVDVKFPGTYNARRSSLEGYWKGLFGFTHGVVVANSFFENVNTHRAEGRALREGEAVTNTRLEFRPEPTQDMLVACLWSRWSAPGEPDLLSFAAITDEPPPEVAAAGHDRCIIPLRHENLDDWLHPSAKDLGAQYAILDDRERPYYEHRMAA